MNRQTRGGRKLRRPFWSKKNARIAEEIAAEVTPVAVEKETVAEKTAVESSVDATADKKVSGQSAEVTEKAEAVFEYFRKIASIPHGSGNTAEIAEYLVSFAQEHGFENRRDDHDNVVIRVPASEGCEEADPVILQGHLDMVCEKNSDVQIDMAHEAITVIEEGDWIHADGTTLGADNGIAVAMMLAVMDDPSIVHPPLECVITADEEIGMIGAGALDVSDLTAKKMLNMDSEEDGVFTAGCAGGTEVTITIPAARKERTGRVLTLSVSGLLGGHSGDAIGKGRANAVLLLGRILCELRKETKFAIISMNGGGKDNAIPRDASAQILLEDGKKSSCDKFFSRFTKAMKEEYQFTDPELTVSWEFGEKGESAYVFTKKGTGKILTFLMTTPNGVIEFSPMFEKLPQTSLNLGIFHTHADGIKATFLVRSSINSQKEMLKSKLVCLASMLEADIEMSGEYPAWEYQAQSPLRDELMVAYEKVFGVSARVEVTHGGLECGLLAAKIPGLECVSFGPLMQDIHTPKERLNIPSTQRTYCFLKVLLNELVTK